MSARNRPSISTRGWLCALAVVGAALVLPASAAAAPTCTDIEASVHHDTTLTFTENPCSSDVSFAPVLPGPQHGTLAQPPNAAPTYTPDPGFVGTDTFQYTGTDQTGTSAPANVTIHVTDKAPTCENTSTTTQQDTPVDIDPLFVGADADDTDWFFEFDPQGQHGHTDAGGTTYSPNPGFVGTDRIVFDTFDNALASKDCFITITVTAKPVVQPPPPPPPPPVDTTKPVFSAAHPKQSLKNARAKGIKLTSTSNEAGTLAVTIKVDKKTARKLKLKRNAKRAVTVGKLTQAIAAGESKVTVKLSKKARKAFKRARKVKLLITMTVTDAAGNATTRSMTVTLKR